jgi:hypothetical protein
VGGRLRRSAWALGLVLLALPAQAAVAEEFASCWVAVEIHPIYGTEDQVTRCRIVGGETVDYASDDSVPAVLYPALGTDVTGQCWYLTSRSTDYVILARFADGSVEIGLDTDPGNPGNLTVLGPRLPRCTSEPTPATDPSAEAWDYAMSYIHDPPAPVLNPAPGDGVTGLDTYLGLSIPDDHAASLSSGLSTLELQIVVDAVVVSWGDGTTETFPPLESVLAGYPDGAVTHIYEVKDPDGATITVEYDWTARWRLAGDAWTTLPVPNTETAIVYPVAEIVSRLDD